MLCAHDLFVKAAVEIGHLSPSKRTVFVLHRVY